MTLRWAVQPPKQTGGVVQRAGRASPCFVHGFTPDGSRVTALSDTVYLSRCMAIVTKKSPACTGRGSMPAPLAPTWPGAVSGSR